VNECPHAYRFYQCLDIRLLWLPSLLDVEEATTDEHLNMPLACMSLSEIGIGAHEAASYKDVNWRVGTAWERGVDLGSLLGIASMQGGDR